MSQPFRLLQISDLHLPPWPERLYRGIDAVAHLDAVLDQIACGPAICDGLLLTGDNLHQGTIEDYHRLAERLDRLGCPWRWIPGNHDDAGLMQQVRPEGSAPFLIPGWHLLLLDSTALADGRGGGSLATAELDKITLAVARANDKALRPLIALHHNPMPVKGWQSAIGLGNPGAFWKCIGHFERPPLVLCGHLHQARSVHFAGRAILSCPSTAVQFCADLPRLAVEQEGEAARPGYRVVSLTSAGDYCTDVVRLARA